MGQTTIPQWGVVCTAREPTALIASFAAHHLALGARYVWIFLDQPHPEAEQVLARLPGCVVQVCDDDYWMNIRRKRRPGVIIRRQLHNVDLVYSGADTDWVLHLDADEFLTSDYPVAEVLAATPDDCAYVNIRPAERFLLAGTPQDRIFDGVFKRPDPMPPADFVPEGDQRFAWRGLTGHSFGKTAVRAGEPVLPGIHSPRPLDRSQPYRPKPHEQPALTLLHFDGLTPAHWQAKLIRLAGNRPNMKFLELNDKPRFAQVEHVMAQPDLAVAVQDLHDRLKLLSAEAVARLVSLGQLETRAFDPAPALAAFGLLDQVDLSAAAFDAAQAALNAPARRRRRRAG